MQNFSAINFTICGGRTLFREVNPILESFSRYGSHHRMSVVTDTPALKANSDLDIAFMNRRENLRDQSLGSSEPQKNAVPENLKQ
jgi:hypothetical protein